MPPLFHSVERHFLLGQFGGFSVSGIHRCPHTSQTRPDAAHALSAATPPHRMTRKSHLDDFEISPVYRRIHASIEMPRKYHHTVPRTNHTVNAKAICARPTTPKPMPKVRKEARMEIGKSISQTIVIKSSLPG